MPNSSQQPSLPPGVQLIHTLRGHTLPVSALAWSPDGSRLFSASHDKRVLIWNPVTGEAIEPLTRHSNWVTALAVTPDGKRLLVGEHLAPIQVWSLENKQDPGKVGESRGVSSAIAATPDGRFAVCVAYAVQVVDLVESKILPVKKGWHEGGPLALTPDGRHVISRSETGRAKGRGTLVKWELETGRDIQTLSGHKGAVKALAVTGDGRVAISGSEDRTIKCWDLQTGRELRSLEGHTGEIDALSLSCDSRLLASKSGMDDTVRLWDCHTGQLLGIIPEPGSVADPVGLAFHPTLPVLATLGEFDKVIRLWSIDTETLLNLPGTTPLERTVQYANAKIVLVGDSGVGKSGLGLVLVGEPFQATESTHGRHVRLFETQQVSLGARREETRETLLWDLAGQPGYRLIHQLHLSEAALALVVFDARIATGLARFVRRFACRVTQLCR
jgi:WD40 repeat protein